MEKETKDFYEKILKRHDIDATVEIVDVDTTSKIIEGIEDDIAVFVAKNKKKYWREDDDWRDELLEWYENKPLI
jgi:hypothetical protein